MLDMIFPISLVAAALVLLSVLTSVLAFRFGAPLLLVFLGIGLIAGEDGLGITYNDASSAYFIGSLALAIILFDSGFETKLHSFRRAAMPSISLATIGVALTAGSMGLVTHLIFGLSWQESLLLGAIVASTDAAAVFFLLRVGRITIRENVRSTLEVESGSNDPMAIFLTVAFLELALAGTSSQALWWDVLLGFAMQLGLGALLGMIGGYVIVTVANKVTLEGALYPIAILAAAICLFGFVGMVGGSGFLAVYAAGLVAGNSKMLGQLGLRRFMEGLTWMAQIAMFLTLGLFATPSQFLDVALPAIASAMALIFVCRPLAVWICLLPFGYKRNETAFVSWVGLRGAVSILLGIIPLAGGLPEGNLLFNVAYIVVLTSLLVQGWTIRPMARWLGLIVPKRIGPVERVGLELPGGAGHELIVYRVVKDSPVLRGERLPRWARPSLVVRNGRSMRFQYAGRLQEHDLVYMFVPPSYIHLLDKLFASPAELTQDDADFYGGFSLEPSKTMSALAQAYGLRTIPDDQKDVSIADYMKQKLGGGVEVGDRVGCGGLDLVVREVNQHGSVSEVGLVVDQPDAQAQIPLFLSGKDMWLWARQKISRRSVEAEPDD
ncbi:potassium/proton antiporter [Martelella soudanensis]|uniref:potassium/proton antiporter n=2 Tax=unclassified Martelella TaxID=2629616 RepID=UPI0015E04D90|nr:potassium/proton antiporter [Martelella sp. NC20]